MSAQAQSAAAEQFKAPDVSETEAATPAAGAASAAVEDADEDDEDESGTPRPFLVYRASPEERGHGSTARQHSTGSQRHAVWMGRAPSRRTRLPSRQWWYPVVPGQRRARWLACLSMNARFSGNAWMASAAACRRRLALATSVTLRHVTQGHRL